MPLPAGVYRADHVGSFLRPAEILRARETLDTPTPIAAADLRKLEDEHISSVVQKQIANGLQSVTDGEFRRAWFHIDFLQHLAGVERHGSLSSTNVTSHGVTPPKLVVVGKLGHPQAIQVEDYKFVEGVRAQLKAGKETTTKVCIPSPTMVHFRAGREHISTEAYPTLDGFFDDLVKAYQAEIADLYASGCRFVQLDDTNLAYLCDEGMRAEAAKRHGEDPQALTKRYAALINAAISQRPKDMVTGIHLCRGNYRSQFFAAGGYEPVAEVLFKELDVDVYFLEYDDERSGDFSPLRFLPENKIVVLGVMSSKKAELDDKENIIRRLNEAAKFCPRGLDQLCLSHQCGFSSTMEGNQLTEEEQWSKVRLEVEIAKQVWGEDLSA
ncbi:methionine synthase-like protein [Parathielavia appendiculata]|uniref:Methionine synthase-like protein n=1 Tax=Parathielavia appendiculata TaxID=2587402 RepID=A0AAN6YZ84_9PEZI|nr:methionine synthase-like protein [Parathielavia appendiculata]